MYLDKTGYLPLNQIRTDFRKENVSKPDTSFRGKEPEPTANDEGQKVNAKQIKAYYGITESKNSETEKKADEILEKIRQSKNIDYIEKQCPNVVKNVEKGKIKTYGDQDYYNYKLLESFRKENPEIFVYFGEKVRSFEYTHLSNMVSHYTDTPIKIAKELSLDEIKQIFKETDNYLEGESVKFEHYMNMLIMKNYNPETYDYILKSSDKRICGLINHIGCEYQYLPSVDFLKNVKPDQIQTMINDKIEAGDYECGKHASWYVRSSDSFANDKEAVQKFSEELSKYNISQDVKLYRGEKSVGMFNDIEIDKDFEKQVRELLEQNKAKAVKTNVTEYTGAYSDKPNTNLYDFIMSKENLTLADAMQVAKYGDKKFVKQIIQKIQESKVIDDRFKSLSFDKGFAAGWSCKNAGDNTTIVQNITVKQGTQGAFHQGENNQFEVILNNTPKECTFQNVVYNKKADAFELESTVQNVNQ